MGHVLTCESVAGRRLVEGYLAGMLSEAEIEVFESHYLTCGRCQTELRMGVGIRELLLEILRAPDPY